MKIVAAYALLFLAGKGTPQIDDIESVLKAAGIEANRR